MAASSVEVIDKLTVDSVLLVMTISSMASP